jgi:hypothetical protein
MRRGEEVGLDVAIIIVVKVRVTPYGSTGSRVA